MLRRFLLAAAAIGFAAGPSAAADPIKLAAKDFKPKGDLVTLADDESKILFATNGTGTAEVTVPADGDYTLTVEASCDEAKGEKAKIKITVGDVVVKESFVLTDTETKEYTFPVTLKKGPAKVVVEFLNDEYKENEYDRNFSLHSAALGAKPAAKK